MDTEKRTVWCGNISDRVTEDLLYELFLQVAPLERVRIPTDKDGRKSNFAFVTFKHDQSVDYAVQMLNGISLFDRRLNIKPRHSNVNNQRNYEEDLRSTLPPWNNIKDTCDLLSLGKMMQLSYNNHHNQSHYDSYRGGRDDIYRDREERRQDDYKSHRHQDNRHHNSYGSHNQNRQNRGYNDYRDRRRRQF